MSIDPHAHDVGTPGRRADAPGGAYGTEVVAQPRRTAGDIVAGILLLVAGVFILGNVTVATVVSVVLLGWTAVIAGAVLLASALWRIRSGGFWSTALGGAGLLVLGLFILRNPLIGALTFALLAGSTFLTTGLGILLGLETLIEGITLLLVGRMRYVTRATAAPPPA